MIDGLTTRITSGGLGVMRLHYTADPRKRPGEPLYNELLKGYPGGKKDPRWRKEMEIEYGALGGTRLFSEWETWSRNGRIVIPSFDPIGYRLYGSYDHGWRHPACYLVHGVDFDGSIVTLWEFWGNFVPASQIARIIKGETITTPDGRTFPGNPYAGREIFKVADPQIEAKDQQNSDNPNQSTSDIFAKNGVHFDVAKKGEDLTVAEWLHGHFWHDPLNPFYRITENCKRLILEIGMQRHKDFSAKVALNRAQPEELVDKDNDTWDALKYFLQRFPPPSQKPKPTAPPNSFKWWQDLAKGKSKRTFRVNG